MPDRRDSMRPAMSDDDQNDDLPSNALATIERAGLMNRQQRRAIQSAARRAKKRNKQLAVPRAATGLLSTGLFVGAFVTLNWWLLLPALMFALASGVLSLFGFAEALSGESFPQLGVPTASGAHIGMGASVQEGAVLEPGAVVEMGATIQSGATIQAGAVVGMGATVESGVLIEANAVIGWGVTVRSGAIVRRGAHIGAGSTVESGAEVPAGTYVGAGGTVANRGRSGGTLSRAPTVVLPTSTGPEVDPRDVRIDELCDRFESELSNVSGKIDEFLRNPQETVTSVRKTCHDLLRRERALRKEANPAEQERLNREAAALETRIATEEDDITRKQLQGAVAAIEEQRRQRLLLLRDANRLEAEQTRLVWTMEGLVAHMVRLRSTQVETARVDLDRGLSTLRDEVASIASAMEQVQSVGLPESPPFEEEVTAPSGKWNRVR
jgi:carbonic anhydrase/acetyltransferase-like protein (isoleucine patch superfamily)